MNYIAVIPARAGSKRLPGKNIKPLGGLPLIGWSIQSAIESNIFKDIIVSTDSVEIENIAMKYGAQSLGLRSKELSTDDASSIDVVIDVIDKYQQKNGKIDGVMLLQPTSPFRTADTIRKAVQEFEKRHSKSPVISFRFAKSHPEWCFKKVKDRFIPFIKGDYLNTRSQDLTAAYVVDGQIYLISPGLLKKQKSFWSEDVVPLLLDDKSNDVDIDDENDFKYAEYLLQNR
jgi:N-acylneuraminate cytidylyltransferase/CMP-N,N'-diacetyllegionaminic acid synthase